MGFIKKLPVVALLLCVGSGFAAAQTLLGNVTTNSAVPLGSGSCFYVSQGTSGSTGTDTKLCAGNPAGWAAAFGFGPFATLAFPGSASLLGSTGSAFSPVVVGSGLNLSGGTLTASGGGISIPNAALLNGNGTILGSVVLGSNLSLAGTFPNQTLNAAGSGTGGGGTVNAGTALQAGYYASTGSTISSNSNVSYQSGFSRFNYLTTPSGMAAPLAGTVLQLGGPDGSASRTELQAHGGAARYDGACFGGTSLSPSAVLSGAGCSGFQAFAYNGSTLVGPLGGMRTIAAQDQNLGGGMRTALQYTPLGGSLSQDGLTLDETGNATVVGLAGSGTRCVSADPTGKLGTACPGGGGGTTTITLNPGLATNPTAYNPGTQTATNGSTISQQLFTVKVTANCTFNANNSSGCSAGVTGGPYANDSGLQVIPNAPGLTITTPAPGAAGSAGYTAGYNGTNSYTLASPSGGVFQGNCPGSGTGTATLAGIAIDLSVVSDGTNWHCIPFSAGGTGASLSANNTWTGTNAFSAQVTNTLVALSGTTPAVNAALGNVFTLTLSGATTIPNPTNMVAGQTITFIITQAASGGPFGVTWSSDYKWPAGTAPTMTAAASAVDMQTCIATSNSVCLFGPAAQNIH